MNNDKPIPCGYILFSRKILKSGIMEKPPLHLKLWVWMIMKAQFKDGNGLKRGQFFTTIAEMRDAMSYNAGYRIERPTIKQIRGVYDFLTRGTMIATAKVTGGMVITILNYDKYQNPKNYEGHREGHNEIPTRGTSYNKDKKDKKNDKKEKITPLPPLPNFIDSELFENFIIMRKKKKAPPTEYALKLLINKLICFQDSGLDPNESLRLSIENNWSGVFEPKRNGNQKKGDLHTRLVDVGKEFIEDASI